MRLRVNRFLEDRFVRQRSVPLEVPSTRPVYHPHMSKCPLDMYSGMSGCESASPHALAQHPAPTPSRFGQIVFVVRQRGRKGRTGRRYQTLLQCGQSFSEVVYHSERYRFG